VDARPGSVPRLNGAVTAQRAIPTHFGFRVYAAAQGGCNVLPDESGVLYQITPRRNRPLPIAT
jgi:hypothetical protein